MKNKKSLNFIIPLFYYCYFVIKSNLRETLCQFLEGRPKKKVFCLLLLAVCISTVQNFMLITNITLIFT